MSTRSRGRVAIALNQVRLRGRQARRQAFPGIRSLVRHLSRLSNPENPADIPTYRRWSLFSPLRADTSYRRRLAACVLSLDTFAWE